MEKDTNLNKDAILSKHESKGHAVVNNENKPSLISTKEKDIFVSRTEKLITALFMVTDCMDDSEPMKSKMRSSGLSVLSDTHHQAHHGVIRTYMRFGSMIISIHELISCLTVAECVGLISSMNSSILKRELGRLKDFCEETMKPIQSSLLPVGIFKSEPVERVVFGDDFFMEKENSPLKDNNFSKGHKDLNQKDISLLQNKQKDMFVQKKADIALKHERRNAILSIIKNKEFVTIKDILEVIKDCGGKTIQRELSQLVSENILKKTGDKRWSRYSIR